MAPLGGMEAEMCVVRDLLQGPNWAKTLNLVTTILLPYNIQHFKLFCWMTFWCILQNWTETYVRWSPKGTYLATLHHQGIALWGGEEFKRLMRFSHPGVQLIDFSPCERYGYCVWFWCFICTYVQKCMQLQIGRFDKSKPNWLVEPNLPTLWGQSLVESSFCFHKFVNNLTKRFVKLIDFAMFVNFLGP